MFLSPTLPLTTMPRKSTKKSTRYSKKCSENSSDVHMCCCPDECLHLDEMGVLTGTVVSRWMYSRHNPDEEMGPSNRIRNRRLRRRHQTVSILSPCLKDSYKMLR